MDADALQGLTVDDVKKQTPKFLAATEYIQSFPKGPILSMLKQRTIMYDYITKTLLVEKAKNPKSAFNCRFKKVPKSLDDIIETLYAWEQEYIDGIGSVSEVYRFLDHIKCCDAKTLETFATAIEPYKILFSYYYINDLDAPGH